MAAHNFCIARDDGSVAFAVFSHHRGVALLLAAAGALPRASKRDHARAFQAGGKHLGAYVEDAIYDENFAGK